MLTFLRKTKEALSRPGSQRAAPRRSARDWVTVVLPRLTGPAQSETHDAQLILGGLRLVLSRQDSSAHTTAFASAVKLDSMLCEFLIGGDRSVLQDTRIMALSLTEVRHHLDPAALLALQRWYRQASDTESASHDAFKKTQVTSKH